MQTFDGWVRRALMFVDSIARTPGVTLLSKQVVPPLAARAVDEIERSLDQPIAPVLRRFLTTGSGGIQCRYVWEPDGMEARILDDLVGQRLVYGGPVLCSAADFTRYAEERRRWLSDSWIAADPDETLAWERSLIFADIDNGDYLALDLTTPVDDPPVIYLDHEGPSVELARSFSEFLEVWERLAYIGPEIWLLSRFIGDDGRLSASGGDRLRQLLSGSGARA